MADDTNARIIASRKWGLAERRFVEVSAERVRVGGRVACGCGEVIRLDVYVPSTHPEDPRRVLLGRCSRDEIVFWHEYERSMPIVVTPSEDPYDSPPGDPVEDLRRT
jgi:hypothetical protein